MSAILALALLLVFSLLFSVQPAYAGTETEPAAGSQGTGTELAAGSQGTTSTTQPTVNTGKGDLAPGTYYFRSSYANTKVMGLAKKKKTNGINVMTNNVTGAKPQRWIVAIDAKGYAIVKNGATGRVLSITGNKARPGTQAVQWKAKSKKNLGQRWIIKRQGKGYVFCSALNKKLVIATKGKKAEKSLALVLQKRMNKKNQIFHAVPSAAVAAAPGQRTIADGTYVMALASTPALAVTIENSSKKTKANAQLCMTGTTAGQAFNIAYDGNGYYTVTNVNSKMKLAMGKACSVPGLSVAQYASVSANCAKWRIDKVGRKYRLVNKATGLALAAATSKAKNGTVIRGWTPNSGATQLFKLVTRQNMKPSLGGTYYIAMKANQNRVLDPKNAKRYNNVNVQIYKKRTDNSNVQKYQFVKTGGGHYYIKNVATKRVMSLAKKSKQRGVGILMSENEGKLYQKWDIVYNEDFSMSFKNAYSGMTLTVAGGKTANGTKVKAQRASKKLASTQKFWLQRTVRKKEAVTIGVPCYNQNPQLPTGCESVALTNALRYWGFDLSKTTMANSWIPYGSDGVYNFIGNPRNSSGWIICAPGIEKTANRYLNAKDSNVTAKNVTGTSLAGLRSYLDKGYPVIIWTTIGMGYPGSATYKHGYPLRSNNHCVVLSGYNPKTGNYQVADSLSGTVWRSGGRFSTLYRLMGSQAVVLSNYAR